MMTIEFKDLGAALSYARVLIKPNPQIEPYVPKFHRDQTKREIVAGGEVRWRPVDKKAAMLLSKSPDICKPNYERGTRT